MDPGKCQWKHLQFPNFMVNRRKNSIFFLCFCRKNKQASLRICVFCPPSACIRHLHSTVQIQPGGIEWNSPCAYIFPAKEFSFMELKVDMPSLAGQNVDPATFQRVWDRVMPGQAAPRSDTSIPDTALPAVPAEPTPPPEEIPPVETPPAEEQPPVNPEQPPVPDCPAPTPVPDCPQQTQCLTAPAARSVPPARKRRSRSLAPRPPPSVWGKPPRVTAPGWRN